MKKKLSVRGTARELNVSATTISFVLNDAVVDKNVSEPVRKEILDYVESIGYKRDPFLKPAYCQIKDNRHAGGGYL